MIFEAALTKLLLPRLNVMRRSDRLSVCRASSDLENSRFVSAMLFRSKLLDPNVLSADRRCADRAGDLRLTLPLLLLESCLETRTLLFERSRDGEGVRARIMLPEFSKLRAKAGLPTPSRHHLSPLLSCSQGETVVCTTSLIEPEQSPARGSADATRGWSTPRDCA